MVWPESVGFPDLVWNSNFGDPVDPLCYQVGVGNLYQRKYSNAVVQIDCDAFEANIIPHL